MNPGRHPFARVGDAFHADATCDQARVSAVMRAIDSVHRAPELPNIRITTTVGESPGEFDPDAMTIKLDAGDRQPNVTLVHEIGHILDLYAFGPNLPDYASRSGLMLLADWDNAVRESRTYRSLRQLLEREERLEIVAYIRYLVDPVELWARSYAQFIARRSGRFSPNVAREMDGIINQQSRRGSLPEQWPWDDFQPVDTALQQLLESESWSR